MRNALPAACRFASAAMLSFMLATCSLGDNTARITSDLRQQLNGSPVCAFLIAPAWPIEQPASLLSQPSIDALISAGLMHREPVHRRSDVTPRARITMTDAGRPYLKLVEFGQDNPPTPHLCFGKKQVIAMTRQADGTVDYSYRITDVPAWAMDEKLRTAFPFLRRLIDQEQHATIDAMSAENNWKLAGGVESANIIELGNTGFYPCGDPAAPQYDEPCR